ncbi:right-handed parallel beta-helix repeat-containing protein [Verrucomicrobiaceae bacterium N1E253]|uniref:Right-handed parallel beta-helix repeat-containing protein n=1 Tax=Oceaniferula marina TaxID=2748318 RepID=A0A851GJZ0_9BACT|nr:right-handed parallel beta-helix repeat-containing protein [Oceaniferula marina]NWK55020.1 right-handed parallel beta-helix repeat-containing protein [Oceaniferula marina]
MQWVSFDRRSEQRCGKRLSWVLIAAVLTGVCPAEQAAVKNGSEAMDQWLQQARALKAKEGSGPVVVSIPPGRWVLDRPVLITPADSGTEKRPVIFKVEDPERTSFSSAKFLPEMKPDASGKWVCELPKGFHVDQLFVDGKRAEPARFPRNGFFVMQGVQQKVDKVGTNKRYPEKATQTVALDPQTLKQLAGVNLDQARMVVLHKWDCTLRSKLHFDRGQSSITTSGEGMKSWNPWKKGTRFFFQNVEGERLQAGQWMLQGRTLSYAPREGEMPGKTEVVAPQLEKLLVIQGEKDNPVSHVQFDGFRWMHSRLNLPNGMPPNQAAAKVDAAIMVDHAKQLVFRNGGISQMGRHAIWFRENCQSCRIEHCLIEDLGGGGVRIGEMHTRSQSPTSEVVVDNCIIRRGGRLLPCAVGVWIGQSSHNRVTHNEINDFYYTGVSVGWTWGYGKSHTHHNKILNNHIHHLGHGLLSDMGAVYTLGVSPGTEVSGNVVHDIESYSYGGWGLYTDEGSTGIRMENNLVYRTKCGGFHQHYGKKNVIRNNIFADAKLYQVQATRPEKHLSFEFSRNIIAFDRGTLYRGPFLKIQNKMNHNLIWFPRKATLLAKASKMFGGTSLEAWRKSGRGTKSVIGDPQFRNAEEGDYFPQNEELLKQIGFVRFDFTKAGVYGDPSWIAKAAEGLAR